MTEDDVTQEPSFEELFEANPVTPDRDFEPGEDVAGHVVKISKESIFVELGGKSEGIVDAAEFLDDEGKITVEVGDRLELKVASVSDAIYLSKGLKVTGAQALEILQDAYRNGLPVEGRVSGVNKGGLDVEISGVRAFCPVSQIELGFCENPEAHIGERYTFRIQSFEERGRNIIVSRRALLEEEREEQARQVLETLNVGDDREGTVTKIMDFGAFVDIGGVDGMVHISEIAHYRLGHPSELLRVGQKVRVRVMRYETGPDGRLRISFSMKVLEPTPWERGLDLREGQVVRGKVTRLMDFGAFVELTRGIEGLVHVSEISFKRVNHPKEALKEGEDVEVRVLSIDLERQRISLSIKEAGSVMSSVAAGGGKGSGPVKLDKGVELTGMVENITKGGLQLRLPQAGPGVRGFLPLDELGGTGREDLRRKYPLGTEIQVEVLAVEAGRGPLLSHKAILEKREREEFHTFKGKDGKSGEFGTLGELFKDLKLPKGDE